MARPAIPAPGFDELTAGEKLDYIQALWDSVAAHPDEVPLPEWHREVIRERLAAHRLGEGASRPWAEVREELLSRLRSAGR